ncbi:hypothetical protein NW766_005795 [Fusarium irregulare]|uniref:Uncharacterized protein n=1 Tax=Fusarium irregulare TaxID=2494466 RepID=A0A9W8UB82_9HYPO|nr:hypothetical protein NW766_005795 [Fusarium irregulare]
MFSQKETNPWTELLSDTKPTTKPTDPMAELDNEDILGMKLNLKSLELVITEAQREAEALRQRIREFEASGHPGSRPGSRISWGGIALPKSAVPVPSGEERASFDKTLRARGLWYLEKVLKIKGLLNRKT